MSDTDIEAQIKQCQTLAAECQAEMALVKRDLEEHERSFSVRWEADQRAIARWQEAHPNQSLTWPDHGDLLVWLLGELAAAEAGISSVGAFVVAYGARIQTLRAIATETAACCGKPARMCGHDTARITLKELGLPIKAGGV